MTTPTSTNTQNPKPDTFQDAYEGVLERIIYFNEETHFCIGELRTETAKKTTTIVISGVLANVQCGETLSIKGQWSVNGKYGNQFKISSFDSRLPSTVHGIRQYLGSGLIPGIGKGYANKIVDAFGLDTIQVISHEYVRLQQIPGIGIQRAHSIKEAWNHQQTIRDIMMFLKTYGVTSSQCLRLVKKYGNLARKVLEENPYRVAQEISGIGFKTADKIALNLGFANDSPHRIDAGILFSLITHESEGHTQFAQESLELAASTLLSADTTVVLNRIKALAENNQIYQSSASDTIQLNPTYRAECMIVERLKIIAQAPSNLPPIIIDKAVEWAQERCGFSFAQEQVESIRNCLSFKLSIITGGPGTGKTTILKALVSILRAKKINLALAAPTGRAAKRMSEATGCFAQTLHRLLQFDPTASGGFILNDKNPLKVDFLIVDEASMLDTKLTASLLKALLSQVHIIFVGDVFQLPSVGAGNILKDFIDSGEFKVTHLNQIFRQSNCSQIVTTAHAILEGSAQFPSFTTEAKALDESSDFCFIKATTADECIDSCIKLYASALKNAYSLNPLQDIQILAPLYKGAAGIAMLNTKLQAMLNPGSSGHTALFRAGDKVIQNRNNYDKGIFNGDLGVIRSIDTETHTFVVDFDDHYVELEKSDMSDLSLAYAISVHKSQGSEFPIVILPWIKSYFIMLQRNLLYTAITRGRKRVFIVGDPAAYAMAINNKESTHRQTGLLEKLAASNV